MNITIEQQIRNEKISLKVLNLIKKKQERIVSIRTTMNVEDNKPYVESYIFYDRNEYLNDIDKLKVRIEYLKRLYVLMK